MQTLKIFSIIWWLQYGLIALMATEVAAQSQTGFSNASLKGRYASMGIGHGGIVPAAGMTTLTADGKGRFVGKTVFNRPVGENGERQVVTFPIEGGYTVEEDGTGVIEIFPPVNLGEPQVGHFMITQADVIGRQKKRIAKEVSFILDKLLPNSFALQTSVLKRLPKRARFSNASLKGTYASMGIGRGGLVPAAGMTIIIADGKGRFVGKTVFNRPDGENGERIVVTFPIEGGYIVEEDGTGIIEIIPPANTGKPQVGHFMITQARVTGEHKKHIATEVSFILDELLPNSAALQTAELKRLPD